MAAADFLRAYKSAHPDQRTLHDTLNDGELERLASRFAPASTAPIDGVPAPTQSGQAGAFL